MSGIPFQTALDCFGLCDHITEKPQPDLRTETSQWEQVRQPLLSSWLEMRQMSYRLFGLLTSQWIVPELS